MSVFVPRPKRWRVHNHHRRPCPPKDQLPVRRQFISCLSTKISSEQIFPLLKLAPRARATKVPTAAAAACLPGCVARLYCDPRRRRGPHKSGLESLHSFWSEREGKGSSGKGQGKRRTERERRREGGRERPCNGEGTTTAPLERLHCIALTSYSSSPLLVGPNNCLTHSFLPSLPFLPLRPSFTPSSVRPTFQLLVFSFS